MEQIFQPESRRSRIQDAYALLGATTPLELNTLYTEADQKLMRDKTWDYRNPDLVTNRVKNVLENIDTTTLSDDAAQWRNEILWFWNHHAISCAVWKYQDIQAAQEFSERALQLQSKDHPNRITKLLYHLTHNELDQAEQWLRKIDEDERETAEFLIRLYKDGQFNTGPSTE